MVEPKRRKPISTDSADRSEPRTSAGPTPSRGQGSKSIHETYATRGPSGAKDPWPGWIALFLTAGVLYAITANRGTQWQDSGHHMLRIVTGESLHPLGLALSHPLHYLLGRGAVSVTGLEPCFAITLISALAAALTVANIYGCALALTDRRSAAFLAAASLALAHTFWQMATVTETYTLTAALLSGECWCLAAYARSRRPALLVLMALCNGLGIANHMLAALTTPVLAVVAGAALRRGEVRVQHLAGAVTAWLVGSLPYTGMILAELVRSGDPLATMHSALFGHTYAGAVLSVAPSLRGSLIVLAFVALNFPNLLLVAVFYGLIRSQRCGIPTLARRALVASLILHGLFALRYKIVDQHTFFLPTYVLLAVFGGIGFHAMQSWRRVGARRLVLIAAVILLACTPGIYALMPTLTRRLNVLGTVAHNKPYRDDYAYLFLPWSFAERSADRMSRQAVALAGDSGLILTEDPTGAFAIRYQKVRHGIDGLDITPAGPPELIREAVGRSRPVVLVPADVAAPKTEAPTGSWRRVGDLYVLRR